MKRSPRDNAESHRRISRRSMMLGALQLGFAGILAARMRYLQVENADQFRLLADENRINIRLIPPARGLIFDRNGVSLAVNRQNYRITVVREDAGDVDMVIERLKKLIPFDPEALEKSLKEMKHRSAFVPVTLAENLSWEQLSEVAVNAPILPGVTPEVGLTRHYPLDTDFAHVVGYVGPVSDYDLKRINDPDPLLQIPRFQIGKSGVEAKLEKKLRGKAGIKRIEVNARGRVMREIDRRESIPGSDVQLTVDSRLQNYVQARLEGESAAAVVIDTHNGDLLAIGSTPSFDPNKFVNGISVAEYKALLENEYRPLANKAVQGTYPPGSTFKMVTALAALEEGLVDPEETIYCPGYITLGKRRFHCWKRGGHGHVNLHNSLRRSCDVYYYELAQRVGIEKISAMARRLGLGQEYPIPMSAVAKGLTPTKEWKLAKRGEPWVIGDTLNSAIGQGFVLASPLQLAVMTARIASGRLIVPRLVKSIDGIENANGASPPVGLSESHLEQIRAAMFAVSNSQRGTAYRSRILPDDLKLAGKTGTSQVRNITKAERARGVFRNKDLPWKRRDHALFVCFAPYKAPRIAVSVVVEHGGGGSKAAAPIARDIVLSALTGGLPPLEAYPRQDRPRISEEQQKLRLRDPRKASPVKDRA